MDDRLLKTINIPIRIVNGKVNYFYGGELPLIKNGALGNLIISEYDVEDKNFVSISQFEDKIEILPKDTKLMFAVNTDDAPEEIKHFAKIIKTVDYKSYLFVDSILLQPLELQLRGSKKSNLLNVSCNIPSIGKIASSINNACTIISEAFEPKRKSHTGNVFEKCYYQEGDNIWYPLDYLRRNEEYKYEEKLFLDNSIFKLKPHEETFYEKEFKREDYRENELKLIDYLIIHSYINGSKVKELYKNERKLYINIINDLLDNNVIYNPN